MKSVLLLGIGSFGFNIAVKLNELNHEVMAVDRNENRINEVLPYVTNAQIGDTTNIDFLSSLDIPGFDVCIVSIGENFQSSLETTSLLYDLGAKKIIATAASDIHEKFLLRNGADYVVYPEKQIADWTARRFTSDHILDFISIDSEYSVYELSVPDEWINKSIAELDIRKKYGISIIAVKINGKTSVTIDPNLIFTKDCTVLVAGKYKEIKRAFKL